MSPVVWTCIALSGAVGIGYVVWRLLKRKPAATEDTESMESRAEGEETPREPVESPREPVEPVESPRKPVETPHKPVETPRKPVEPPRKPVETPRKPVEPPAEPQAVNGRRRINRSRHDDNGTVQQSAADLLAQARKFDPAITLDELTGARLAASEHGSGSFAELAAIVDSEMNRAEKNKVSLFGSLTHRGTFGSQGRNRPASTRRDPEMRHLLAARAVLSGKARGIAQGATRFFDPEAMERMNRRYRQWIRDGKRGKKPPAVSCDALDLLEAWSFDLGKDPVSGNRCPPDRTRRGKQTMAWVGEIDGVDPLRLMLMEPMRSGEEHTRRYEAARARLIKGLGKEQGDG